MNPRITALVIAYNCADRIGRTLESVFAQTYPAHEIIVVDDGSTDGTGNVLDAFGGKIRCIHQKNSGVAEARNAGIRIAQGDWIAFLDDDDVWAPDKLEEQAALIARYPGAGMIFTAYEHVLTDGRRIPFSKMHPYGASVTRPDSPVVADCFYHLFMENFLKTSTVAIRTDLLRKNLFDQSRVPAEDRDVFIRVAAEAPVLFCRKSLVEKFLIQGSLGRERLCVVDMRETVQKENYKRFKPLFREARRRNFFHRALTNTKRQRISQLTKTNDFRRTVFAVLDYLFYRFLGIDLRGLFIH